MRKFFAVALAGIFIAAFLGTSIYTPVYGGAVRVHNGFPHNVYLEINGNAEFDRKFYLEKDETVKFPHILYEQGKQANPNNAYTYVDVFNATDGTLLKRISISDGTFTRLSGDVDNGDALFYLDVTSDTFLETDK